MPKNAPRVLPGLRVGAGEPARGRACRAGKPGHQMHLGSLCVEVHRIVVERVVETQRRVFSQIWATTSQ